MLTAALITYVAVSLLYWLRTAWGVVRLRRGIPHLERLAPPEPHPWPRLSVVVAARDEAAHLEAAARTLLAQDYPDLEIVLVDDRSADATGAIVDRLAAEDPRVRALHVADLPEGWLGKVHALERGFRTSTGALVLFTDADIHFEPGALRRAVAWCEAERLDHLTALPRLRPTALALSAVVASFIRQFLIGTRAWAAGRRRSGAYLGVGAFNLVRRSALEAAGGFAWLRMEVADDMGLGLLLMRSGARQGVVAAFDSLGLAWYHSLGEAMRGAEKGFSAVCQFSALRAVVLGVAMLILETSPAVCPLFLLWPGTRWAGCAGIAVALALVVSTTGLARWAGARVLPGLLGPAAAVVNAVAFIRAGIVGRRRGGVLWRGTLYPTAALREGNRVRFP